MATQTVGFWNRVAQTLRLASPPAEQGDEYPRRVLIASPRNVNPIGAFGTRSFGGYPYEDYLDSMRGRARADTFDKMRRSDPQIKMCLAAVKNPIKSAVWEVHPGEEENPEYEKHAEFIEHVLFKDLDQPWVKFLSEALTVVDFGHSVFEITHKVVLDHKEFGSYIGIGQLGFRSQRTIERWDLNLETGQLASIQQIVYGDMNRQVSIPADFLLVFSLDKEGANYEGISALRSCYGCYFRKDYYMKLNAAGVEKFAIPTPIATIPKNKENSTQYENLIDRLERYTQYQSNYLTIPEGFTLDLKTNTYDPTKVEASINAEDERMVRSFLANFLTLGQGGGGGAYALSNDLSDFFLAGLEHLAIEIESVLNEKLIPALIDMNFGPQECYPELKHSGISDKAGKELAECLKFLSDSKYVIPDDPLEEHLRKRFNLTKKSIEGQRQGGISASPFGGSPEPSGDGGAQGHNPHPDDNLPNANQPKTLAERVRAEILRG